MLSQKSTTDKKEKRAIKRKERFIKKLPQEIQNIIFLNPKCIECAEFLDRKISVGTVLRVPFLGDIRTKAFETGALVMAPGSEIREHGHTEYEETYSVIYGDDQVILDPETKDFANFNICQIGKKHFIKNIKNYTLVIYTKTKV
jgi:mannose-6-phosphate isomerase-like protein (cupin superfamily)